MIIGTSMEGKVYDIYRNTEEPFDEIEVDWLMGKEIEDYTDEYESYKFIESRTVSFVEDDWTDQVGFHARHNNLLVECDYCGDFFTVNEMIRQGRASSFRQTLVKAGYEIEQGERFLYKDNCDKCLNDKKRETTIMTHGVESYSYTEEFKSMIREVHKDSGFVRTSRGQRYIAKLLNAKLNVLIDYYFADIVLDDKIVIEYDGGGHNLSVLMGDMTQEQFDANERKRSGYLFSKGYKIVRFISPEELFPENEEKTKQILCNAIAELYLTDKKEIHIEMSTRVNDPVYGKLKPIKNILLSSEWGEDIL